MNRSASTLLLSLATTVVILPFVTPAASAREDVQAGFEPLLTRATEVWDLDVTTTGGAIHWTSPTALDPGAVAYDVELELTMVRVTHIVGTGEEPVVDMLDLVETSAPLDVMNIAGPGPTSGDTFTLSFPIVPSGSEIPSGAPVRRGDITLGVDGSGSGTFDLTDVDLGLVWGDLFPGLGAHAELPVTSLRLVGQVTVTETRWTEVGGGVAGSAGLPRLRGDGTLIGGDPLTITLTDGADGAIPLFVMGFSQMNTPFKGGTFVPNLDVIVFGTPIGPSGEVILPLIMPVGVPPLTVISFQIWMMDFEAVAGYAGSNGLTATSP